MARKPNSQSDGLTVEALRSLPTPIPEDMRMTVLTPEDMDQIDGFPKEVAEWRQGNFANWIMRQRCTQMKKICEEIIGICSEIHGWVYASRPRPQDQGVRRMNPDLGQGVGGPIAVTAPSKPSELSLMERVNALEENARQQAEHLKSLQDEVNLIRQTLGV